MREALTRDGVVVEAASREVLTRPVGVTTQEDFHNQVLRLRSPEPWSPRRWLEHCKAAESASGRRPTYHWGPRVADIDILLLGEHGDVRVNSETLTVPHRELRNRPFLMRLLREIDAPVNEVVDEHRSGLAHERTRGRGEFPRPGGRAPE
jgi:2-amino-4-hydroxy-6-hydroxymethyldihydropteridine diphosphokinase